MGEEFQHVRGARREAGGRQCEIGITDALGEVREFRGVGSEEGAPQGGEARDELQAGAFAGAQLQGFRGHGGGTIDIGSVDADFHSFVKHGPGVSAGWRQDWNLGGGHITANRSGDAEGSDTPERRGIGDRLAGQGDLADRLGIGVGDQPSLEPRILRGSCVIGCRRRRGGRNLPGTPHSRQLGIGCVFIQDVGAGGDPLVRSGALLELLDCQHHGRLGMGAGIGGGIAGIWRGR